MSMDGSTFTIALLATFAVIVLAPLVLYRFRNPDWQGRPGLPGQEDTTGTGWKRGD
ncbi:MAG: hypothetical protein GY885_08435 [Phycisphaeraceae bacterium]|nr:hypothetical protein [Phycisphaeraceae bacterium]